MRNEIQSFAETIRVQLKLTRSSDHHGICAKGRCLTGLFLLRVAH
jgi:hypothetical protein